MVRGRGNALPLSAGTHQARDGVPIAVWRWGGCGRSAKTNGETHHPRGAGREAPGPATRRTGLPGEDCEGTRILVWRRELPQSDDAGFSQVWIDAEHSRLLPLHDEGEGEGSGFRVAGPFLHPRASVCICAGIVFWPVGGRGHGRWPRERVWAWPFPDTGRQPGHSERPRPPLAGGAKNLSGRPAPQHKWCLSGHLAPLRDSSLRSTPLRMTPGCDGARRSAGVRRPREGRAQKKYSAALDNHTAVWYNDAEGRHGDPGGIQSLRSLAGPADTSCVHVVVRRFRLSHARWTRTSRDARVRGPRRRS